MAPGFYGVRGRMLEGVGWVISTRFGALELGILEGVALLCQQPLGI
jgi:hypothetical protein